MEGYTLQQKDKMMLSKETRDGLKMTGLYIGLSPDEVIHQRSRPGSTVQWEIFAGQNFRETLYFVHFAKKIVVDGPIREFCVT